MSSGDAFSAQLIRRGTKHKGKWYPPRPRHAEPSGMPRLVGCDKADVVQQGDHWITDLVLGDHVGFMAACSITLCFNFAPLDKRAPGTRMTRILGGVRWGIAIGWRWQWTLNGGTGMIGIVGDNARIISFVAISSGSDGFAGQTASANTIKIDFDRMDSLHDPGSAGSPFETGRWKRTVIEAGRGDWNWALGR